jgi:Ca2+-binding EF-hand superfamily protein
LLNLFDNLGSVNTRTGVTQSPGTSVAQTASVQPDRDRMFSKFDKNGDGEISKDELQKGMSKMQARRKSNRPC